MISAVATDEDRRIAAAAWVVRLAAPDVSEADALAFAAWLATDPDNPAAYDRALAVWQAFEAQAPAVREALKGARPSRRAWIAPLAAAGAAAMLAVVLAPQLRREPAPAAYATAAGEHRSLTLADGSRIDLNGATRLTVALRGGRRDVRMEAGEAIFDVAHDPSRPFVIAAGDRAIRVVGTQFDVRRRGGALAVTVTRGLVEVGPAAGAAGQTVRLHPGQKLQHLDGASDQRISAAPADEALGWRSGRLVYRGQPLAEVVADLNAQFHRPITVSDPALAATPISGVLILDNEDAVVRRLALLVSAQAIPSGEGVALQPVATPQR